MKNKISGINYDLRLINDKDANFIVNLRNDKSLNKYIHNDKLTLEDQLNWQKEYYKRNNEYYFVVFNKLINKKEGLISVYNYNKNVNSSEWGRWIIVNNSFAAVESVYLLYKFAFENLGLSSIYCLTINTNFKVVSFHDSCGIKNKILIKKYFKIKNKKFDAIKHTLNKKNWNKVSSYLSSICLNLHKKNVKKTQI